MGKTNWVLQYLKFRSCLSETGNGKDLCHLVRSMGVGTAPVWGSSLGWQNSRDLSLTETWEFGNCFGGREGSGSKWLLSPCPSLPIGTASLTPQALQAEWHVPASVQTIPRSAILWQQKEFLVQHLCFQEPGLSFVHPAGRSCTDQDLEWPGAHRCLLPVHGRNHSIQVGKSPVQMSELKQATALWLSSHTLKIYGQVVPRQAGIFYRWGPQCLAREVAQQPFQLLPKTQNQ